MTRGLAGLFYIDDSTNRICRYGIDDIPIILQDRTFDSRGQFSLRGRAVTGALGDKILVNGTYNPHLPVTTRQVRLRILNASTARIYHLAFADDREFALIATDVGFLPSAQQTRRLLLSPAKRAEIVVDLKPGERPVLRSVPWDLHMMTLLTTAPVAMIILICCNSGLGIRWPRQAAFRSGWRRLPQLLLIMWRRAGRSSSTVARSTVSRWRWLESTRLSGPALPSCGPYGIRIISRTISMSTEWRSRSFRQGRLLPILSSAGRTPSCWPPRRRSSWRSSSRRTRTRGRLTCTTVI